MAQRGAAGLSWRALKRAFDPQRQGRFLLILGTAKSGKTTALAELYRVFERRRIFWISAGELDGWRAVIKATGVEPEGFDVDELRQLSELWQVLRSLRDGSHDVVVLDSFDGAARWAEAHICGADEARRRDKRTGINKLDQRGYGLKLNWTVTTVRDFLYPLTLVGTHVLVTCGLKNLNMAGQDVLAPDIEGQGSLVVPRFFGDVGVLKRERSRRIIAFEDSAVFSVAGSRSGIPDPISGAELARWLLERGPNDGVGAEPWWRREFPDIGPTYLLADSDFRAAELEAVGLSLEQASDWRCQVIDDARARKRDGLLGELSRRDRALLCWAFELEREAENGGADETSTAPRASDTSREP